LRGGRAGQGGKEAALHLHKEPSHLEKYCHHAAPKEFFGEPRKAPLLMCLWYDDSVTLENMVNGQAAKAVYSCSSTTNESASR